MMKRLEDQRGIALALVLIALATLMIIVVEFVFSARVYYAMAANARDELQAEYMAKSAMQFSLLIVKYQKEIDQLCQNVNNLALCDAGPLYQQIPINSALLRGSMNLGSLGIGFSETEKKDLGDFLTFQGNFSAQIIDEQTKTNLNLLANLSDSATAENDPTVLMLKSLFEQEKYKDIFENRIEPEEVIYNLKDWVDADSERSGNQGGYEDGLYARKEPKYVTKNAKFDTLDEISMVEGVTQEFLDTFREMFTVYGTKSQFNLNSATREMREGFLHGLLETQNDEEVERILDWMEEIPPFRNREEVVQGLQTNFGYDTDNLNQDLLNTLSFESTIFSIIATGTVGEEEPVTKTLHAVVSTTPQQGGGNQATYAGGLKILYWRIQ